MGICIYLLLTSWIVARINRNVTPEKLDWVSWILCYFDSLKGYTKRESFETILIKSNFLKTIRELASVPNFTS